MPLTLTEIQLSALSTLDWLLNDGPSRRMSGRSTIMAVALIRLAAASPNTWVDIRDHINTPHCREHLKLLMQNIISQDPQLMGRDHYNRTSLRLDLSEPVPDWLPESNAPQYEDAVDALRYTLNALKGPQEEPRPTVLDRILSGFD